MSIWKTNKTLVALFLALAVMPTAAKACNPINPICLFQKILKACPGMPVLDFASLPAIIPHIPAALQKEGITKLKQIADEKLEKIKSGGAPQEVGMNDTVEMDAALLGDNQTPASLEAFPSVDSEKPEEIAKAVEVLFLRPGWDSKGSKISAYDKILMQYYRNQFALNNRVEIAGFLAVVEPKMKALMANAEKISNKMSESDDVNKARRANFEAHLLGYQLAVLQNQVEAANLQTRSVNQLVNLQVILNEPIFSK